MRSPTSYIVIYFFLGNLVNGFGVQNEATDCVYKAKYEQKYNQLEVVARDCFGFPPEIVLCIAIKRNANPELTAQELGFSCISDLPKELRECWRTHHDVQKEMRLQRKECEGVQSRMTSTQIGKLRQTQDLQQRLFAGRLNAVSALVEETGAPNEFFVCMVELFDLNDRFMETYTRCKDLENKITDQEGQTAAARMYELFRYYTS